MRNPSAKRTLPLNLAAALAAALSLALPATNAAALDVIFDNGRTQPIDTRNEQVVTPPPPPMPPTPGAPSGSVEYDPSRTFPIESPALSLGRPGQVPEDVRPRLRHLPQPIFLIGADPTSKAWLAANRQTLTDTGAIGFLIEASSLDDYRQVLTLGQPLRIAPVPGDAIASALGLSHYPVLITREGWSQ